MLPRRLVQDARSFDERWPSVFITGLLCEAVTLWPSKDGRRREPAICLALATSASYLAGMSVRRLASTADAPERAPQYSSCCRSRLSAPRAEATRTEVAASDTVISTAIMMRATMMAEPSSPFRRRRAAAGFRSLIRGFTPSMTYLPSEPASRPLPAPAPSAPSMVETVADLAPIISLNSRGSDEHLRAFGRSISPAVKRSASDWLRVCISSPWPVDITE